MHIEKDLVIDHILPDSLDIYPRGSGCDLFNPKYHEFFAEISAAGFTYQLCGRCGGVRITEKHS